MASWKVALGGIVALGGLATATCALAIGYAVFAADSRLQFPEQAAPLVATSSDPLVIAQGEYMVRGPAHCSVCHAADSRSYEGTLDGPLDGGLAFEMGPVGTRYASNLTPHPEHGIGRYTDAELARAIRHGVLPSGELSIFMSLSVGSLSDEDLVAVISYLRAQEPVANEVPDGQWFLFGKVLLTYAFPQMLPRTEPPPAHVPASDKPTVDRGEYLVQAAACMGCHTAFDMDTMQFVGPEGGGGMPEPSHFEADKDYELVAPNLTSHATGITGQWSEDAFVNRLQAGRSLASSNMPWENYGIVSESDLRSIYRALKTLPQIDNDVGPSYRKIGSYP